MNIHLKLKERYIVDKSYNIMVLRVTMYICIVVQLLCALLPMTSQLTPAEWITNLLITLLIFSLAYIVVYLFDVFLFYIIFKKYINNSMRMAEKQIAPLLFLQLLIPFMFNVIGCFISLPNLNLIIRFLQLLIMVLYVGYLAFTNIFKEKCIKNLVAYFIASSICDILASLLETGISV